MKISFFVHDLASNPVGRAFPLAEAARRLGHEVEVLGFMISGEEVYLPYRDRLPFLFERSTGEVWDVVRKARVLAGRAGGDLLYACKPLLTSLFPALIARGGRPVFLDVEDDDVWAPSGSETLSGRFRTYLRGFRSATAPKYGVLLHPFVRRCDQITVSTRRIQRRYGGTRILHGPDELVFDPGRQDLDPARCREMFGLPPVMPLVVFAGTPWPHKGLDLLLEAIGGLGESVGLVLCGDREHPMFRRAKQELGDRCFLVGFLPNDRMPHFLTAGDIVPVFQKRLPYAEAQLPAKMLEAMAMEKAVIASDVADCAEILGARDSNPRGWVVPPGDLQAIRSALQEAIQSPLERRARGQRAREYYLQQASTKAISERLEPLLKSIDTEH